MTTTAKKSTKKNKKPFVVKRTGRVLPHPNAVEIIDENGEVKIVSRTWVAVLEHRGTGKILDMRAVLK
ncbi:MAG: hypothetical protein WCY89_01300 [Flavobacteriaceae bacterium]